MIYNLFGIVTRSSLISPKCHFSSYRVQIGENTFINTGCYFETSAMISIGRNCSIGMEVMLCASTHEIGPSGKRAGKAYGLPVAVGDGCWIGARAVILPGVTVGDGCIIAAGAVVTGDCEPNGLYAGIPARRIRELDSDAARKGEIIELGSYR